MMGERTTAAVPMSGEMGWLSGHNWQALLALLARFLLTATLAGGELFGSYAPFGVAMVGASGSGATGLVALLGAVTGYFGRNGFLGGVRYVAASILVYAVAFALYDLRVYRTPWFMPTITALFMATTGFVYLSTEGWRTVDVIFFISEVTFSALAVYLFENLAVVNGRGEFSPRQRWGLCLAGGCLLLSLTPVLAFELLSAGRIVAVALALVFAYHGGSLVGGALGMAVGLIVDLAVLGSGWYGVAYGLSALVAGLARGRNRVLTPLLFVATHGAWVLWTWGEVAGVASLYEVACATLLFLILPTKLHTAIMPYFTTSHSTTVQSRGVTMVHQRLSATAEAYRCVGDALQETVTIGEENYATIFDRTAQRICRRCALSGICWQRDYITTFNALNDATAAMVERGRGLAEDFPTHFASRCIQFPQFLATANEELTALLCRRQYHSRLRASRQAVCRQYQEVSGILSRAASQVTQPAAAQPDVEKRVARLVKRFGIVGESAVYVDSDGRLTVEVPRCGRLQGESGRAHLERTVGVPLETEEGTGRTMVLHQAPPLTTSCALARCPRQGEGVSGDSATWFHGPDGTAYTLLCDGMGSGTAAARESRLAVNLLEKFLSSGMAVEGALRTLNGALALHSESEGGFTTVDLLALHLFDGTGAVYKMGGAPTYLRRGNRVSRLMGTALPAGLGDQSQGDKISLQVTAGDWLILVSDGVTSGDEDGWLRQIIHQFDGTDPQQLAQNILTKSDQQTADDRTVLVLSIQSRA